MRRLIKFAHPTYQLILMTFSLFFIFFSIKSRIKDFFSTDKVPTIVYEKNINKNIKTGFYVKNFLEFDIVANKFILDGVIWFRSELGSENFLDKFSVGKGTLLYKSDPIIETFEDQKIYRYDVKIDFPANLTYKYFPLSDHVISFVVSNPILSAQGFNLECLAEDFKISPTLYVDGWHLSKEEVKSGTEKLPIFTKNTGNSRLVFSLSFKQISKRTFVLILFPLLVGLLLAFLAFSVDILRFSSVLSLSTASISSIIGYRFVMESMSPKVSYFMFSDVFFLLILFFTCLSFFINIFYREQISNIIDWLVLFLYLSFVGSWYLFLTIWF